MFKNKRSGLLTAAASILLIGVVGFSLLAQVAEKETSAGDDKSAEVRQLTLYVDTSLNGLPDDLAENPDQRYHLIGHVETRTGPRRIEIASDCLVRSIKKTLRPRQRPTEIQMALEVAVEMPITEKNRWFQQANINAIAYDHSLDLFELWTVPIDKAPHRGETVTYHEKDPNRLVITLDNDRYPVPALYEMLLDQPFSIAAEKKQNGEIADSFRLASECEFLYAAPIDAADGQVRSLMVFRVPQNSDAPRITGHQFLVLRELGYEFSLLGVTQPSRNRKTVKIEVPLANDSPAANLLHANIGNRAIHLGVVFQAKHPGTQEPVEAYNVLAQPCELVDVKTKPGTAAKQQQLIAVLEASAEPPQKGAFLLTQAFVDNQLDSGNRFRLEGVFDPEKTPQPESHAAYPVTPGRTPPLVVRIPTDPIEIGDVVPGGDGQERYDIHVFRDKSAPQLFADQCVIVVNGGEAPNVTWAIPQDGLHHGNRKVSQPLIDNLIEQGYQFKAKIRRPVPLHAATATPAVAAQDGLRAAPKATLRVPLDSSTFSEEWLNHNKGNQRVFLFAEGTGITKDSVGTHRIGSVYAIQKFVPKSPGESVLIVTLEMVHAIHSETAAQIVASEQKEIDDYQAKKFRFLLRGLVPLGESVSSLTAPLQHPIDPSTFPPQLMPMSQPPNTNSQFPPPAIPHYAAVAAPAVAAPPMAQYPPVRVEAAYVDPFYGPMYPALPGATTLPPPLTAALTPIRLTDLAPSFTLPRYSPAYNPALNLKIKQDQAVAKLRQAKTDDEKTAAAAELRQVLSDVFRADMLQRYEKTRAIETQLKKLRDQHEARDQAKDEIIDLQLKLLEKQAAGLDFPPAVRADKN